MKPLCLLTIALMLTGCAEFGAIKTGIAQHGATAADEALSVAKWQTCIAPTVGSLMRDLGGDQERIAGWILWCGHKPANVPIVPPMMQKQSAPLSGTRLYPLGL